jgi:predicted lipoprotein
MTRLATAIAFLIVAAGVFWLFPLFHIVRTNELSSTRKEAAFNAAEFAQEFWSERLMPWVDESGDTTSSLFFVQVRKDPEAARERFGRQVGVSRARLFVLSGKGTIMSRDTKGILVRLGDKEGNTDVVLHTGLVFGNTVRDASGLLNAGDFANSQHFNEVSTELNRLVETRVISKLKEQAAPGRAIEFVGCAQLSDDDKPPVRIIPLRIEID